jgi:hypothetical protein
MAVMIYALTIYQMRARSIRLRTGAPYDDRLGPVSLTFFLPPHPLGLLRIATGPGESEAIFLGVIKPLLTQDHIMSLSPW